jgi:hypothetical protein
VTGHQGGARKKVAPVPLPCERCGRDFLRTSGNQVFCAECKPVVDAERKADWRRKQAAAKRPSLGELEHRHPVGPEEHQQAKRALGLDGLPDLLALGSNNDPFYCGTPYHRQLAEWFAGLWESAGFTTAHLRRVHYQLGSTGAARANGEPYLNTTTCWSELGMASRYARYLGLVDADAIEDRRNDAAVVNCPARWDDDGPDVELGSVDLDIPRLELPDLDIGEMELPDLHIPEVTADTELDLRLPQPSVSEGYEYVPERAALVEIWIEKSTMDDILRPLCRRLGINLVVGSGHESITATRALLRRAQAHGRAAHVLYVSDFDPAGDNMPAAVARQAQFWAGQLGIGQRVTVQPVALTRAQVEQYRLPPVPIKDTDRRAPNFKDKHDIDGAVELDALEALHPGELARIIRAAAAPWLDDGDLAGRLDAAQDEADQAVRDQWNDSDFQDDADDISDQAAGILDRYQVTVDSLNADLEPVRQQVTGILDRYRALVDNLNAELEPLREQVASILDGHQAAVDDLNDELDPLRERVTALEDRIAERFADTVFDLPGRPEPAEPDVDRDGFLYDSERSWLIQREHWQRHRNGES